MTKKEQKAVIKILNDLVVRVHTRKMVALEHRDAAIERVKRMQSKMENGYVTHWDRQAIAYSDVEYLLGELIKQQKSKICAH